MKPLRSAGLVFRGPRRRLTTFAAGAVALGVASLTILFASPDRYRASDFPCSTIVDGPCHPAASAERANAAVLEWRNGVEPSKILENISLARMKEWRGALGTAEGLTAGRRRTHVEEVILDSRRGPLYKELHERALRDLRSGQGEGYRPLSYVTEKGVALYAGEIRAGGLQAHIRLCTPDRGQQILDDALARLVTIRREHLPSAQAHAAFLDSMYGFFVAAPYETGNGDIGREFYAATYRALFGAKISPLPDGTVMYALTALSPREFGEGIVTALRWPMN